MKILLATSNTGKASEFKNLLTGFDLCTPLDFPTIEMPSVDETGKTYFENALIKAMRFHETYHQPVLADDSGLECDGLGGKPGVATALFAAPAPWPDRWQLLNDRLNDKIKTAHFRAILCYYDGVNVPKFFQGSCDGEITIQPRGDKGFGYDPIFWIPRLKKTLAELDANAKNQISHRGDACRAFISFIASLDRGPSGH